MRGGALRRLCSAGNVTAGGGVVRGSQAAAVILSERVMHYESAHGYEDEYLA